MLSIELFWHDFHNTDYTQADWQELRQPSIQALNWYLDVFINTFINLRILVESYMPPHRMITQLRTVYSKIVHNCYWYTDYTHCSWINNALVTRQESWSAYENYVWLTVTSSFVRIQSWWTNIIKNDSLTYKTIINMQIDKFTTSVIVIAIHFVTPIEKDRTRYDWFSIWKSYLSLLFLVIIVEICAKAEHRINRYCLKRVSDVTFSMNNGSNGLNLKTMEMTDGDHLEFWH